MLYKQYAARFAAIAAASALTLAAAMAQGPGPGGPPGGGPGQGPGPGGPGGGPGTFLGPAILKAADLDKDGRVTPEEAGKAAAKLVRDADTKKAGAIDGEALGRAINKLLPPPPGFGDGDGPPPGDFGPGTFFGPMVLTAADADKDGKLSPEEAAKAAEAFVRAADSAKKGSIDADTLALAMNKSMGGPGGPGGPFGGPGGMMGAERAIVKDHDKDGDGHLDVAERKAAREAMKKGGGRGGFRMGPGMFGKDEPGKPGPKVARDSVPVFPGKPIYDPTIVRTLFLDFEGSDWEAEMADFNDTDVDLPATLTVDGKTYPNVGVHFRGLSSFMMVAAGSKRSLNIAMNDADPKQKLGDYKTLNLLNAHEDNTFLHTVLYLEIARKYLPAPRANFVKVVINGESWGLYVNTQQFDKQFLTENFSDAKGTRFKVPGNPGARGGLEYQGDDPAPYKPRFAIKCGDDPKAWAKLVNLCKVLNQTPADKLEEALKPILDIDGVLWFLALDNALINNDGYWVRSSDYSMYLDSSGKFHILPHDTNETFGAAMMMGFFRGGGGGRPGGPGGGPPGAGGPPGGPGQGPGGRPGGPGGMGGGGGVGLELDPLIGLDDPAKPLRSKLLAVPALRAKYLAHVRTIARDWLAWEKLNPVVAKYRAVIDDEVAADTRKLMSNDAYKRAVGEEVKGEAPRGRPSTSLREFAEKRGKFLLNHPEIKKLPDDAR